GMDGPRLALVVLDGPLMDDAFLHDAPMTGRLVDRVRAFHGRPPRLLVDVLAAAELRFDDVDLLDVLQPGRPLVGADGHDATHDLGQSPRHDPSPRHRAHRAARVDARALGGP